MSKIWFTSDFHINHFNVIRYCNRPFNSVEQMNETIINNFNEVVRPEDTVYFLGDFSLSIKAVQQHLPRLMGEKILVTGNHDLAHPHFKKKALKYIELYKEYGFAEIHTTYELSENITLSHFPYLSDNTDERYPQWRLIEDFTNENRWLFCGHVHEKWRVKNRQINVGVDVWDFRPVQLETLLEITGDIR
jgi:calcineurin-like phosphoesterase family protein